MVLFLRLYLGHLLGDFVFQPGRLVVAKRKGLPGMVLHTGIIVLSTVGVMLGDIARTWPVILIAGAAHFGIEHLTVRARHTTHASGLKLFLLDQALHIVSLVLIAFSLGASSESSIGPWPMPTATIAAVCGVVAVAFLGSILAFEVQMVALGQDAPAEPILKLNTGRIYGMIERGGALAIALLAPAPPLGVLAFAPRVAYALAQPPRKRMSAAIDAAVGLLLCVTAWAAVALLVGLGT